MVYHEITTELSTTCATRFCFLIAPPAGRQVVRRRGLFSSLDGDT